jgi:hypothetical protein
MFRDFHDMFLLTIESRGGEMQTELEVHQSGYGDNLKNAIKAKSTPFQILVVDI